ncbi:Beta-1,4-glucuronyltransferase 1 [Amphibalanus amphitrite]|uniref:Beta-1,4-glucuronyltransferase 1 n=1 Tax=Amphibalanus amphitrite TaxID=1232801 RepID=A0A6A4VMT6_AMPAM|nr:Beta-1,4-glucuronyltransferase 1 [Amphibalanus amphitrite]
MRPSASLLRFSLVLNACLLFSYGVWYMHQSTVVGFVPEPTAQAAPVARTESYRKAKHLTYPVNVLRNVARETVMTHYVLPSDVELYPSEGLAEQFIDMAKEWTFSKETQQMDVFHVGKRHPPFEKWEPIYICTNQEPAYDERLTWEGKMDKMGQGYTLCIQDYDFMILNNAFLVHKPGIKKYKPDKWRDTLVSKQRRFILSAEKLELERMFGRRKQCNLS